MNPDRPSTLQYPAGAKVRVKQICTDNKTGKPGLLPICAGTWWKMVKAGKVPPGTKMGPRTTVWPIEAVLAVAKAAEA